MTEYEIEVETLKNIALTVDYEYYKKLSNEYVIFIANDIKFKVLKCFAKEEQCVRMKLLETLMEMNGY